MYLTSFRGSARDVVLRGVSYGNVSDYQRVRAGIYTVSMRAPGAAADSPPLLRTNVTVRAGAAYTVAGVGPHSDVQLRVLTDDLSRPSAGTGRVRVVQASSSAPVVDVVAEPGGAVIANDASFPSTTGYADVRAQQWRLRVEPRTGNAKPIQQRLAVAAGSVYSVVVLDAKAGGVAVETLQDAGGPSTMPRGSVAAGGGELPAQSETWAWLLLIGSITLICAGAVAWVSSSRLHPVAAR